MRPSSEFFHTRILLFPLLLSLPLPSESSSTPFPFETNLLSPQSPQVLSFPSIQFPRSRSPFASKCRAWPNTPSWPSEADWAQLNTTLDGALLRPFPAAAACYPGHPQQNLTQCNFLTSGQAGRTHYWLDNPVETLTTWPAGWGCLLGSNVTGNCERGGWPEYVVNVSSVKHIQAAVNFARNKGVRVVVKYVQYLSSSTWGLWQFFADLETTIQEHWSRLWRQIDGRWITKYLDSQPQGF